MKKLIIISSLLIIVIFSYSQSAMVVGYLPTSRFASVTVKASTYSQIVAANPENADMDNVGHVF